MRTWVWLAACLCVACSKATAPGPSAGDSESGPVSEFSDNWGDSPCVPRGPELTLRGRIQVKPFGKGTDGVLLVAEDGASWVVSYRAEHALLGLDGKWVKARGRACDKQFEAVAGRHFDLQSVTRE